VITFRRAVTFLTPGSFDVETTYRKPRAVTLT
jgi:hypothetical protein